MKRSLTQPIILSTLLIVVSAVFLPGKYYGVSTKDVYLDDPVSLFVDLDDNDDFDTADGDEPLIIDRSGALITLPPPPHITPSPTPALAPDIVFIGVQPRAPPRI